jgi:hypothetical protein
MNEIQKPYLRGSNPGNRYITPLLYPVQSGLKFTPLKEEL